MDLIVNISLWTLINGYKLFTYIARPFLLLIFPVFKRMVDKRLRRLGYNTQGEGPLGIQVHDEKEFYLRIALEKNFGLFEAHMDKICTINDIKEIAIRGMRFHNTKKHVHPLTQCVSWLNLQTKSKAWEVGDEHYDIGNDLYEAMLGKTMQYTCGYWRSAGTLDDAQTAKMDLIARKLKLKPGMRILDVGCGYGTLGQYLAENYGVRYVGCSISLEQTKYAKSLSNDLPVEFILCDYRDLESKKFDRVVSVGMLEHVGPSNYKEFFKICNQCMKDDGLLLIQTIGINHPNVLGFDLWSHKNIFPNGHVPYYLELCKAIEGQNIIEDWQNLGFNYAKTLAAWEQNFDKAWEKLQPKYGDRFYRMWKLYLGNAQAFFLTRSMQLYQIVLSRDGIQGGYETVT